MLINVLDQATIDAQSALDHRLNWYSVDKRLTLDQHLNWHLIDCQTIVGSVDWLTCINNTQWGVCKNNSSVDRLSTEVLIKYWQSMDGDVLINQEGRSHGHRCLIYFKYTWYKLHWEEKVIQAFYCEIAAQNALWNTIYSIKNSCTLRAATSMSHDSYIHTAKSFTALISQFL